MSVDRLASLLNLAKTDGQVSQSEVDELMLEARSGKGLDAEERALLRQEAEGFDDASMQRAWRHLSAMEQPQAWVNVEGPVVEVEGRYATLRLEVPGMSGRMGLFDSVLAMTGAATEAGEVSLLVDGEPVSAPVVKGDTAAVVLERLATLLPAGLKGVVLSGEVKLNEAIDYGGPAASAADEAAHLLLYRPDALQLREGEVPMRVIVTGYGAFMGITDNPSARMAREITGRGVVGSHIEYRRLDVTTQAVDAFMEELRANPPDVVLSMGVSSRAKVEERPENRLGSGRDGNREIITPREVRPGGPAELKTDLPVDAIDWSLRSFGDDREVATSLSDPDYKPDRSAYLCNYLGYSLAAEYGSCQSTTAGFVHITKNTPPDQMHAVLTAMVSRQLEWRRTLSLESGDLLPPLPPS